MTLDEAIKLIVTLHTPSDKLQRDIIHNGKGHGYEGSH